MKVVINVCFGGYGLSDKAIKALIKLKSPAIEKTNAVKAFGGEKKFKQEIKKWKSAGDGYLSYFGAALVKNGYYYSVDSRVRTDPKLISVVEKLGKEANGQCAELRIVEIPDEVEYEIDEYDGNEHIAEAHRTWR
jgi:hypothetical protein